MRVVVSVAAALCGAGALCGMLAPSGALCGMLAPSGAGARTAEAPPTAESAAPPYFVAPGVFDVAQPDLGLRPAPGTQTFTIFRPGEGTDKFSNGVVLIAFRGKLFA